jgi:hypothetical protein
MSTFRVTLSITSGRVKYVGTVRNRAGLKEAPGGRCAVRTKCELSKEPTNCRSLVTLGGALASFHIETAFFTPHPVLEHRVAKHPWCARRTGASRIAGKWFYVAEPGRSSVAETPRADPLEPAQSTSFALARRNFKLRHWRADYMACRSGRHAPLSS